MVGGFCGPRSGFRFFPLPRFFLETNEPIFQSAEDGRADPKLFYPDFLIALKEMGEIGQGWTVEVI